LTLAAVEAHSLIAVEHLHRYELAAELCQGLRVADVGCGSGYGSRLMRASCPSVTGIDVDEATIEVARATVGQDADMRLEVAEAQEFLEGDLVGEFDAIVMLETLEHLERPEDALNALRRHAAHGLKAVVSVPNSKWLQEDNPYHRMDFGYEEALDAFAGFEDCVVLYQFLAEGSLIRSREGSELAGRLVATERGEPEYANHFIACINLTSRLAEVPDWAQMHLEAAPLYNRYMRNLELAHRELRRANARLAREKLGKADSAAVSVLGRVERERQLLEEQRRKEEYDPTNPTERQAHIRRINELNDHALKVEREMREFTETRAWRIATGYWAARDRLKRLGGRRTGAGP
jgi:SAM-dependent methyltransferase